MLYSSLFVSLCVPKFRLPYFHTSTQVYPGTYRKPAATKVTNVANVDGLQIDQLVAVRSPENSDIEPWIGKVLSVLEMDVRIVWLDGGYSNKWRNAKIADPSDKRKKINWKDTVPKDSIILFDFQLTPTGHLRRKTIEHLQQSYSDIKKHVANNEQ